MHTLTDFLVRHLYLMVFLWVAADQLGVPIPSVPVLLTVGTLSATHRVSASLSLLLVLAACTAADSVWYLLGRRYGSRVLEVLCKISFESSTCINKTQAYFSSRGALTLVIAKFVPGLGNVAPPISGQTGMSYARFLLWDLAGSVLWAESFILAGRFFGDLAERSHRLFYLLGRFAFVLFLAMVVGLLLYRILKQRRFLREVAAMRVDPADVMKLLDEAAKTGSEAPYIVDLRHPLDYLPDPRVLPGAARIGPADLQAHADRIPRDRDIILYCTCPSEETSAKVAMQLHKLGISRVRPLKGGFDGWKAAGYPLEDFVPIS
jgi:membrane protein DedA with SNARE-associated domain/rhodanese-related sulfurtransferase